MGVKLMMTHMRQFFIDGKIESKKSAISTPQLPVNKRQIESVVEITSDGLRDTIIAVDAWNFINRCVYSTCNIHRYHRMPIRNGDNSMSETIDTMSLARLFVAKVFELIENDIYPIFVFDQDRKPVHTQTSSSSSITKTVHAIARGVTGNQVSNQCNLRICKGILNVMGVAHLTCRTDAENVCKLLVDRQIAFAALTEDTDIFAMGCPVVLTQSCTRSNRYLMWNQAGILRELGVSQTQFSHVCVLMGTDDCVGVSPVGCRFQSVSLVAAVEIIKEHGDIQRFLSHVELHGGYVVNDKAAMLMSVQRYVNPAMVILQDDAKSIFAMHDAHSVALCHGRSDHNYPFPSSNEANEDGENKSSSSSDSSGGGISRDPECSWTVVGKKERCKRDAKVKRYVPGSIKYETEWFTDFCRECIGAVSWRNMKRKIAAHRCVLMTKFSNFTDIISMHGRSNHDVTWRRPRKSFAICD